MSKQAANWRGDRDLNKIVSRNAQTIAVDFKKIFVKYKVI